MRPIVVVLLAVFLSSCGDGTAPDARLLGTWTTSLEDLGAGLDRVQIVRFHANGTMDEELRLYRNDDLTESYRLVYEYEVRGDSLFTRPANKATRDLIGTWTRFDRGRFDVDGGRLTITYPWSGPADEPITVTTVFWRTACPGASSLLCM